MTFIRHPREENNQLIYFVKQFMEVVEGNSKSWSKKNVLNISLNVESPYTRGAPDTSCQKAWAKMNFQLSKDFKAGVFYLFIYAPIVAFILAENVKSVAIKRDELPIEISRHSK